MGARATDSEGLAAFMCLNGELSKTSWMLVPVGRTADSTSSNKTSSLVSMRQTSSALALPRSLEAPSMNSISVISPSPLSKNSKRLNKSWYSSSSWLIQNWIFGDSTSFANSWKLMAPSPDKFMDWNSFFTFLVYVSTSFCFCLKAISSSELAVFMVCCTNTAFTTFKTANPRTQRYSKKNTENHSLTLSTSTLQGGPQLANNTSNMVRKLRVKVP
mmetsp:Transcript_98180/g.233670  ORF Transcript_98180/g.233670 Transcript_98180/m.233670 type:complete len:216 (-) Transcript_98180:607-1254(-)